MRKQQVQEKPIDIQCYNDISLRPVSLEQSSEIRLETLP